MLRTNRYSHAQWSHTYTEQWLAYKILPLEQGFSTCIVDIINQEVTVDT